MRRRHSTTTDDELKNVLVANPLDSAGTAWTRRPRDATSETNVRSMVLKGGREKRLKVGESEEGKKVVRGRAS